MRSTIVKRTSLSMARRPKIRREWLVPSSRLLISIRVVEASVSGNNCHLDVSRKPREIPKASRTYHSVEEDDQISGWRSSCNFSKEPISFLFLQRSNLNGTKEAFEPVAPIDRHGLSAYVDNANRAQSLRRILQNLRSEVRIRAKRDLDVRCAYCVVS
jgi:hypothetical protein